MQSIQIVEFDGLGGVSGGAVHKIRLSVMEGKLPVAVNFFEWMNYRVTNRRQIDAELEHMSHRSTPIVLVEDIGLSAAISSTGISFKAANPEEVVKSIQHWATTNNLTHESDVNWIRLPQVFDTLFVFE